MTILNGNVAIITGAGAGLGRAIARSFAADGAKLVICDVDSSRIAILGDELRRAGAEVVASVTDVSDPEEVEVLIATALTAYGQLDILVNNAGIMDKDKGVGELALEDWDRVLAINLTGPMLTMRAAVPHMVSAGGGQIINIASTAALRGGAAGAAYTAAKHGLIGLTRSTAWLYAANHLACNVIAPGGMNTGMPMPQASEQPSITDQALSAVRGIIPGSLEPEMVASAVRWAVGMGKNGLSGAIIPVDAGWSAG